MKGLYFQQSSTNEEVTFVFQEKENVSVTEDNFVRVQVKACALSHINTKLLAEMKMEKEFFPVGREVAGIVLDVHKPEKVPWTEAAGVIRDGVRAYTALYYLSQLSPGKSVLIMDGASAFGTIAIQLAHHRGAKVISTAHSLEDKQHLERLRPSLARVIDVSSGKVHVAERCLEETGGLGVDIVIDAGVRLYSKDDEPAVKQQLPHKHDIITLLSVGGHWITTEENLQLDPPDSHCLFLKGATVAFLNDEVWNLSNAQQGKYLCILKDVMEKLSAGVFRPLLDEPIPLYEAKVSMEVVQKSQERKKQVVQF
ncbi:quinone oxidoreductase-like protein 1 isoform X5 [Rattus norvegicus]|uniref:quinone oxidoreductase-like protein 1 isoform X5 n=1 Tax=Rattus norvegicus TaxID=10116 RepID=UPI0003D0E89B|nr:quinone oxidoreductase-like protein 1 isoform X1 [Rattus norvegicus]|eukprot:XP_006248107.1 PREDICTED: quinone oxidoreductase-like protein 1 isoform X1 [Rattus norvegicus]